MDSCIIVFFCYNDFFHKTILKNYVKECVDISCTPYGQHRLITMISNRPTGVQETGEVQLVLYLHSIQQFPKF